MIWIILIVLVVLAVIAIKAKGAAHKKSNLPYTKIESLFSPAEMLFLSSLDKATEGSYRVFGKVRVADIVAVKKMSNKSHWQKAFNKIALKHFDFVLCDKNTLKTVAIIELDDSTHNKKQEKEKDELKNAICAEIKLPLIRVKASNKYDSDLLKKTIEEKLNIQNV